MVRRPTLRTVASAGSRSSGTLQLWSLRPVNCAEREQLAQRTALVGERVEDAVVEAPEAPLDLLAGAADGAVGVALAAGLCVEDRSETVVDVFERVERVVGFSQQIGVPL